MRLYPDTPSVTWPTHDLDPRIQTEARRWVVQRAQRATGGFLILAIVTIPLVVAPFFMLACAVLMIVFAKSLAREGRFVPTVLVDSSGRPIQPDCAAEAFETSVFAGPTFDGSTSLVLVRLVHLAVDLLTQFLAGFAPALIVHHHFKIDGKVKTTGKYMFRDEHFYVDGEGWRWALVHPKRPRVIQWPVSTRGPAPRARAARRAA